MKFFDTYFMEDVTSFFKTLDPKIVKKIIYNIRLAEQTTDPRLLKKIKYDIWEFRTNSIGLQIRLLCFWDKSDSKNTLIIATNGFIKKNNRIPGSELEKAIKIREKYFNK